MPTVRATTTIMNAAGLHARAATRFVQMAGRFECEVLVSKDNEEVNGKSIMGVLLLVATQGSQIEIRCVGADASECLAALLELVASGFGEIP